MLSLMYIYPVEMLEKYHRLFEDHLEKVSYNDEFRNLYDPISYTLNNKGKRLRPITLLIACETYCQESERALPASLAIEVFHNFTLLHDDIMDKAPMRRGKPSVFKKYGTNAAILSGDAMLIQSYKYLENYPAVMFKSLMEIYSRTALEVCEGQQLDIDFETNENVSIPDYLKMIELKTAVLIAASLKMGGIIGGANEIEAEHLYQFGKNLGIAFQLQDDILDAFGEEEKIGKQSGGDIIQKKKTYLYLKTLDLLVSEEKEEFVRLYNSDDTNKVEAIMKIFNTVVVKEYANQVASAYLDLAMSHLYALNLNEDRLRVFKDFVDGLMKREN